MAQFSKASLNHMAGIDARLMDLAFKIVSTHMDCTVPEYGGLRTEEEQRMLVATKRSKTMQSKHLQGKAIDLVPYPVDWKDTERFYLFAGMVLAVAKEMGIPLRWGGDWDRDMDLHDQKFNDLVHFELVD